jgi:hypothetical protein
VIPLPVLKKVIEEIFVLCPLCLLFFSFRKFKKAGEQTKRRSFLSFCLLLLWEEGKSSEVKDRKKRGLG